MNDLQFLIVMVVFCVCMAVLYTIVTVRKLREKSPKEALFTVFEKEGNPYSWWCCFRGTNKRCTERAHYILDQRFPSGEVKQVALCPHCVERVSRVLHISIPALTPEQMQQLQEAQEFPMIENHNKKFARIYFAPNISPMEE